MKLRKTGIKLALLAGLALGATSQAFAGTAAGTNISNTATVNFSVGGVAQTAQNSNTASFFVDRKVSLTVTEQDGTAVTVVPGATRQVTTFKVTNLTNDTQDFRLAATLQANPSTAIPFGGSDDFNMANISVFVQQNNGTAARAYSQSLDTATFIDELGANASAIVYVVADVPSTQKDGDISGVVLTAIAAQSTAANGAYVGTTGTLAPDDAQTNTSQGDTPTFIDTVFAENASTTITTDPKNDGKYSIGDQYNVVSANIVFTKAAAVVKDPINGTSNAKAIPGATINYCLTVQNTGSAAATTINLTDALPTTTTYVPGTIYLGTATANSTAIPACTPLTGTQQSDSTAYNASASPSPTVTVPVSSLANGFWIQAQFEVTVN